MAICPFGEKRFGQKKKKRKGKKGDIGFSFSSSRLVTVNNLFVFDPGQNQFRTVLKPILFILFSLILETEENGRLSSP